MPVASATDFIPMLLCRFFTQQRLALPETPPLQLVDWSALQRRAGQAGRQPSGIEDDDDRPVTHTLGVLLFKGMGGIAGN